MGSLGASAHSAVDAAGTATKHIPAQGAEPGLMEGPVAEQSSLRFLTLRISLHFPNAQRRSPQKRPRPMERPRRCLEGPPTRLWWRPPRRPLIPSGPLCRRRVLPRFPRTPENGHTRASSPSCPRDLRGHCRRQHGRAGQGCPSCPAPRGSLWRLERPGLRGGWACRGGACPKEWTARPGSGPSPAPKASQEHQVRPLRPAHRVSCDDMEGQPEP